MDPREQEVLARIEQRRRRPRRKLLEERVTLSHGAGGKASRDMVEALFLPALGNALLAPLGDAAVIGLDGDGSTRLAVTTDAYVVKPLAFPGGDIGELAVNGTINDLAVSGAQPLALAAAFVVEEGLPIEDLGRYAASMGRAAAAAGVPVATGDTKVVERGKADGLYVCTTGVGVVRHELSPASIRAGDRVLVSGTIGDHGMAIMVARGDLALEVDLSSDTAALHGLAAELLHEVPGVRCMRDPTRGGLATTLVELAQAAELAIVVDEQALPVRPEVAGACEILGLDPLYVANEGKLAAIVAPESADAALAALRAHPLGGEAAIVGEVTEEPPGMVLLDTALGGSRVVDMLAGDPLPRIC